MSNDWDFYPLRIDDLPGSIYVDLGIRRNVPIVSHPTMTILSIQMLRPRPDGLSSQDEYADLIALEDSVTEAITQSDATCYVGRSTSGGFRDFYFYTSDTNAFLDATHTAMQAFPAYTYEVEFRDDPTWRAYLDFLYPSPRSMQVIQNRRVRDELAKSGDNGDRQRVIDHFAYLPSQQALLTFTRVIETDGFTVSALPDSPTDSGWGIHFSRVDRPAHIDDVVLRLFDAIVDQGGEYDGWECPVEG